MELDTTTLRVALGVATFTMLILFYFVTFRTTRSGYSGWWCLALTWFLGGSAAFLLNDTDQQYWANPLGNALLVLGAASAWTATRSLSGKPTRWWQIAGSPALTWIVSVGDNPGTNIWAGGPVFLAMMCLMFGLSARELWQMDRRYTQIGTSLAGAATAICAYYLARWIVFLAEGPDSETFEHYVGSQVTTVVSLVFLVAVSFSMSVLSNEQLTNALRIQATQDGLTGLLNRAEFLNRGAAQMRLMRRAGTHAALILADLDNFKEVNDTHGHPAGDRALQAFAHAATQKVRPSDLVCRYGGEEFILLLPHTSLDRAEQITSEISLQLADVDATLGFAMPTVSFGIASTDPSVSLDASIASADTALYRAKTLGRNRAVREDNQLNVDPTRANDDNLSDVNNPNPSAAASTDIATGTTRKPHPRRGLRARNRMTR